MLCVAALATAGRAMLVSLAAAPLLAKPAFAQDGDAVDSAVDSLTSAIKVRVGAWGVLQLPQGVCHSSMSSLGGYSSSFVINSTAA